jgi:GNAT superfamily N-acetyltransferase
MDALLERSQWDFFWLPKDCSVVDRPELLYAVCPRDWMTANVITRIRSESPGPLLDEVLRAHAGRATRVLVCPQNRTTSLLSALRERGFEVGGEFRAHSLSVDADVGESTADVRPVSTLEDIHAWLDVTAAAFGFRPERSPQDDEDDLAAIHADRPRAYRCVAWQDGEPVGAGGLSSHPGLGLGLLWAGAVAPSARGRGVYTGLLKARLERAKAMGLDHVGLYAKLDTSAPIVAAKGFTPHGLMTYFERAAR